MFLIIFIDFLQTLLDEAKATAANIKVMHNNWVYNYNS